LLRNPKRGGQGPTWAVEPYDDDDEETSMLRRTKLKMDCSAIGKN
jgi:hypothetical protein